MKTFYVEAEYRETYRRTYIVEAESKQEAQDLAETQFEDGGDELPFVKEESFYDGPEVLVYNVEEPNEKENKER